MSEKKSEDFSLDTMQLELKTKFGLKNVTVEVTDCRSTKEMKGAKQDHGQSSFADKDLIKEFCLKGLTVDVIKMTPSEVNKMSRKSKKLKIAPALDSGIKLGKENKLKNPIGTKGKRGWIPKLIVNRAPAKPRKAQKVEEQISVEKKTFN